jgi:hypothetical protein
MEFERDSLMVLLVAPLQTPKRFIVGGEEEEPGETERFIRLETLVLLRRLYRQIAFAERMLGKGPPQDAGSPVQQAMDSLGACTMVWEAVNADGLEVWEVEERVDQRICDAQASAMAMEDTPAGHARRKPEQ